jgi:hypothetical protein
MVSTSPRGPDTSKVAPDRPGLVVDGGPPLEVPSPWWDPGVVFERFTDRARRVLVLAQEEARLLNHNFIGTEHLLLGLIQENEGVAAQALAQLEISLDAVRAKVEEAIGRSDAVLDGSPPFTPRSKKVLELALREALQRGHNYIGTEHLLLGLVREGEGVAAQVLVGLGADLARVRHVVVQLLSGHSGRELVGASPVGAHVGELVECSFCGRRPPESGRLVSGRRGAFICEPCVANLNEKLSLDPETTSSASVQPVVISGRTPADEGWARDDITRAFGRALVLSEDRRTVPNVEGGDVLGPCLKEAQERHASLRRPEGTIRVGHVVFIDEEHATVSFTVSLEGVASEQRRGDALVVDSTWKMARTTFCELMKLAGVDCPSEP